MSQAAIASGLFTLPPDEPRLIGSRCEACGATTFPVQDHCPRCTRAEMKERFLPQRGTLVSWTTQEFLPKEPYAGGETEESFTPFGVGLVQLENEVRVEARLTECDPAHLDFGMDVALRIVPFRVADDGTEILTFAFAPV